MRSKFGFGVIALAAAALVLTEASSFAGRRGGCKSCGTACSTCTVAPSNPQASAPAPTSKDPASAVEAKPSDAVAVATGTRFRSRGAARRGNSRR